MNYEDWVRIIPMEISGDAVWTLKVYRLSLYLSDLCWQDTETVREQNLYSLADQLFRSVGSISANISEGYSRYSYKEQARYYEIDITGLSKGE